MTEPTKEPPSKESTQSTTNEIAEALNEPAKWLVSRVVKILGEEQARALCQQALEVEANDGMMTKNGKRRRTPGGTFLYLVRGHAKAIDKKMVKDIFRPAKENSSTNNGQPKPKPKKPAPTITWDDARKYAIALLNHEKGNARTVEVKLIGRPTKVAKSKSCMVAMMEGKTAPKSLPKGLPTPPEQVQNFAVFIGNKQWNKVSEELKTNANAELLVNGFPVFNPEKAMTMVLAQSVEVIERKPKKAKEG